MGKIAVTHFNSTTVTPVSPSPYLPKRYDLILLSNIIDYYSLKNPNKYRTLDGFFKAVEDLYNERLNDNGMIQITSRDYSVDSDMCMGRVYDFINLIGATPVVINNSGMNDRDGYNYPSLMIKKVNESQNQS